jgi:hypothetical protein
MRGPNAFCPCEEKAGEDVIIIIDDRHAIKKSKNPYSRLKLKAITSLPL